MNVLIPKAGSNRESVKALDKSQAYPLITWLVGLKALRHVDPNWSVRFAWTKALLKSIEQVCHPNVRDKTRNNRTELQATTGA